MYSVLILIIIIVKNYRVFILQGYLVSNVSCAHECIVTLSEKNKQHSVWLYEMWNPNTHEGKRKNEIRERKDKEGNSRGVSIKKEKQARMKKEVQTA